MEKKFVSISFCEDKTEWSVVLIKEKWGQSIYEDVYLVSTTSEILRTELDATKAFEILLHKSVELDLPVYFDSWMSAVALKYANEGKVPNDYDPYGGGMSPI